MTHSAVGRIHLLTLGTVALRPNNVKGTGAPMLWWTFTARRWTDPRPVHAFVIEHHDGAVLWDTGQSPDSVSDGYFPGGLIGAVFRRQVRPAIGPDQTLAQQLADAGFSFDDIALAALSHLHYDHAGNVAELSGIPILISDAEHALLAQKSPQMHGVLPEHVAPAGVLYRPVSFVPTADAALSPFEVAHDIYGEGSLVLLPTPGHSPGSMSLLVRRGDGRPPLLLVGDVTYDPDLLARGIVPDVGERAVQQSTAAKVAALGAALPGLVILAAHDPRAVARLEAAG